MTTSSTTTSAPATSAPSNPTTWRREEHNPLCGDELSVQIRVKDGRIQDLRFDGHGCAISQASASIASEELMGMELEEVGSSAPTGCSICSASPSPPPGASARS